MPTPPPISHTRLSPCSHHHHRFSNDDDDDDTRLLDRQHNDLVTMVLSEAGSNSRELQAALDHYKETDKRIHATAVYTVGAALGRKGVAGKG